MSKRFRYYRDKVRKYKFIKNEYLYAIEVYKVQGKTKFFITKSYPFGPNEYFYKKRNKFLSRPMFDNNLINSLREAISLFKQIKKDLKCTHKIGKRISIRYSPIYNARIYTY